MTDSLNIIITHIITFISASGIISFIFTRRQRKNEDKGLDIKNTNDSLVLYKNLLEDMKKQVDELSKETLTLRQMNLDLMKRENQLIIMFEDLTLEHTKLKKDFEDLTIEHTKLKDNFEDLKRKYI